MYMNDLSDYKLPTMTYIMFRHAMYMGEYQIVVYNKNIVGSSTYSMYIIWWI